MYAELQERGCSTEKKTGVLLINGKPAVTGKAWKSILPE